MFSELWPVNLKTMTRQDANQEKIEKILRLKREIAELEQSLQAPYGSSQLFSSPDDKATLSGMLTSDQLLDSILDSQKEVIIFALDREYRYLIFNQAHQAVMKNFWKADIQVGKNMLEMVSMPEEREKAKRHFDRALSGESFTVVEEYTGTSDKPLYWELSHAPILNPEGEIIGLSIFLINITELKESESRLEAALKEADRANRAKSDFLSSMSHELRTPLSSILGFGHLLLDDKVTPLLPEHREYVEFIMNGGEHLLILINDILDLSKIEEGELNLNLAPVRLVDLLREVSAQAAPLAREMGVLVNLEFTEEDLEITGDYTRLKQVIMNLVSNAIKYNKQNGQVDITCKRSGENLVQVSVADTGIGIAKEHIADVYKPFNRLGMANSSIKGTGIGLTISRRLLEMMGGMIHFESELNVGSTFLLEIPVEPPDLLSANPPVNTQDQDNALEPDDIRRNILVLYIEDDVNNLRLMESLLRRESEIELLLAENGPRGLEISRKSRPDLIILDINLPGMNGFEILGELRKNQVTKTIPVVALSADAMPGQIEKGKEAGFAEYLTKPLNIGKLKKTIFNQTRVANAGR